jgi:membrane-associated phospholipid phosphatase
MDARSRWPLVTTAIVWTVLTVAVWVELPLLLQLDLTVSGAIRAAVFPGAAYLTHFGEPVLMFGLLVALLIVLVREGRKDLARFVAGAALCVALFRWGVLWYLARERPEDGIATALGWSYPSGHSAYSAAAALILVCLIGPYLNRPASRMLLALAALAWPATVGVTRIALGVHWPSDVAGGILLAIAAVWLARRAADWAAGSIGGQGLASRGWVKVDGFGRPDL